jgi:hypothetical protein
VALSKDLGDLGNSGVAHQLNATAALAHHRSGTVPYLIDNKARIIVDAEGTRAALCVVLVFVLGLVDVFPGERLGAPGLDWRAGGGITAALLVLFGRFKGGSSQGEDR